MMQSRLRDGTLVETYDAQERSVHFFYETALGRVLLRGMISPWVSRCAGRFLDSPLSKGMVKSFVRKNHLNLEDYPQRKYRSFNDFFTRRILPDRRPTDPLEQHLISPCDGKLTVFSLKKDSTFHIKGSDYTLEKLLRDPQLAECYCGGWGLLFRLTVDDYHRYAYPVTGQKGDNVHIPGVFHTVNPKAAESRPIYQENTREYTLLKSDLFGTVLMMEIGAMLVGRITNFHGSGRVQRGTEKGLFEFGGSSILLLLEPDCFSPDEDLLHNSARGEETVIRMGERVGSSLAKEKQKLKS